MKQVLQNLGSGETLLAEVPCPTPRAGVFPTNLTNLREWKQAKGFLSTDFTDLHRFWKGGFSRESPRMGANKEGRGSFRPQISQICTDGEKGCPFDAEGSVSRCVSQKNLCESV